MQQLLATSLDSRPRTQNDVGERSRCRIIHFTLSQAATHTPLFLRDSAVSYLAYWTVDNRLEYLRSMPFNLQPEALCVFPLMTTTFALHM